VHCLLPIGVRGKSHKATLSSSQRGKKRWLFWRFRLMGHLESL